MQVVYVPSHLYHMVFELFKVCALTIIQFCHTSLPFEPILDSSVFLQVQTSCYLTAERYLNCTI